MLSISKDVLEAKPLISNPPTSLALLFVILLLSSRSKFSAKRPPIKQISNRSGPSNAKAIVFGGSEMATNTNSLSKNDHCQSVVDLKNETSSFSARRNLSFAFGSRSETAKETHCSSAEAEGALGAAV